MKAFWTRLALTDLESARAYVAEEGPGSAAQLVERIEKAVESLVRHPELGRPGRVGGTRELVVPGTPFIIPYRMKAKRLEILAVVHGARLWPDQL